MESSLNAFGFLLNIIQSIIATVFIARLVFQWTGVNMSNPIAQFVLRFTQPLVAPLQKIFPTVKRFNFAVLFILFIINVAFTGLYFAISGADASVGLIAILSGSRLLQQVLDFLFWSIVVQIIFSWLPNAGFHPIAQIAHTINAPLLRPIQKLLPHTGGFDFSPIIVIVAIKFIEILLLG